MTLFRYLDALGGIKTLADKKLRLASPLAFNDPFELTPRIERPSDDLLFECLKQKHIVEGFVNSVGAVGMTRKEAENRYYAEELPKRFMKLRSDEGWAEKESKSKWEYVGNFAKSFRILCCSRRDDSILMWSHYADKHRGVVIEFDADELLPGTRLSDHALDVVYRSNPPTIPALFGGDMPGFESSFKAMLSTKALEWSHEEEVRIAFPAPDGIKKEDAHFLSFNPQCIKRVIVGCYDHPDLKLYSEINRLAGQADYSHVRFQRAYLDFHDYKLRFADRVNEQF